MTNKIEKYPAYKPSGVEWLGDVPKHWEVLKGKWLFIKEDRPVRHDDGIVTCFRDGEVTLRTNRKKDGFTIALKEHGYQGIRKGDLVIHNMDAFAGAIGVSDSDGKSTPVYSVCTPRKKNVVLPSYYSYFLRDMANSGFIESLAKGIRERSTDFRFSDFSILLLSVPPLEEQEAIIKFIDHKTSLIDQAISIKQKQIELLKERRQILIHNTVTRGLNPSVKMKNSGVEWIGEIPEHWEVKRLKHIAIIVLGKMLCNEDKGSYQLKPYLKSKNIQWLNVDVSSVEEMWFSQREMVDYRLKKGDLVLSEGGEDGKTCIWNNELEECYIQNSAHKVTFYEDNVQEYYLYLFFSAGKIGLFESIVNRVSIGHLTKDKLINIEIIQPPKVEQVCISEYIETLSHKIKSAITLKEKEIEKLKEYKATLINSAVTGKIKVN